MRARPRKAKSLIAKRDIGPIREACETKRRLIPFLLSTQTTRSNARELNRSPRTMNDSEGNVSFFPLWNGRRCQPPCLFYQRLIRNLQIGG